MIVALTDGIHGTVGATHVRFLFGFPFALLFLAAVAIAFHIHGELDELLFHLANDQRSNILEGTQRFGAPPDQHTQVVAADIDMDVAASVTLGVGQFCTNPGLVIAVDSAGAKLYWTDFATQKIQRANLDGTGEKKIADGIFPAISPDGTRVAFNTTEKTSDTTYARHIAVIDVSTGKIDVFKNVPSDNSYYPSWTADGKQILFTTRPHEVWDLAVVNSDGTNFHVLKPGVQGEVTRYSPVWARDGQSVFCEDMSNIYQIGLDGAVRAQWKINKIVPKGDMSGDGRIDVSPDGTQIVFDRLRNNSDIVLMNLAR